MASTANTSCHGMAFVTIATHNRRPVFHVSRLAELFIDALLHYRAGGHYKLHAYLVMPDCVHLILTPQGVTLEQAVHLIKAGFVQLLDTDVPIWQPSFAYHSISTARDLKILRTYIHMVPVHAHLIPAAELYPYSSAYRTVPPIAPREHALSTQ
jgi:putative transposase